MALAINTAQPIIKALVENGKVVRAYLGISIMDEKVAAAYGYTAQADGVLVFDVQRDGPADRAGMRRGDIIVKVDGKDVKSVADLREILDALAVGSKVTVELNRDGRRVTANPVAAEMPN
jgi:serine protease Do